MESNSTRIFTVYLGTRSELGTSVKYDPILDYTEVERQNEPTPTPIPRLGRVCHEHCWTVCVYIYFLKFLLLKIRFTENPKAGKAIHTVFSLNVWEIIVDKISKFSSGARWWVVWARCPISLPYVLTFSFFKTRYWISEMEGSKTMGSRLLWFYRWCACKRNTRKIEQILFKICPTLALCQTLPPPSPRRYSLAPSPSGCLLGSAPGNVHKTFLQFVVVNLLFRLVHLNITTWYLPPTEFTLRLEMYNIFIHVWYDWVNYKIGLIEIRRNRTINLEDP